MKLLLMLLFLVMFLSNFIYAQDNLLSELDSISTPNTDYTIATFKATRVISSHSVENMKSGQLEFRISHRFGKLNSGADNFWGLDNSTTFLSLEYGLSDNIEIGIGRTPNEKILNSFAKIRLITQSNGDIFFPTTISYLASAGYSSIKWNDPLKKDFFNSRLHYVHQLLIARKLSEDFSLQLSPTLIHRNYVQSKQENNDNFSLGIAGRYKLSPRLSFNFEYFHSFDNTSIRSKYKNPLSIGFDIETGGHVFQLMLSNSQGMIEKHYITDNTDSWSDGGIHFGFNISRVFTLY